MLSRFEIFIFLSIVVHTIAASVWLYPKLGQPTQLAKKTDQVAISVGMQAALAGAFTSVANSSVAEPIVETKEIIIQNETLPTPIEVTKPQEIKPITKPPKITKPPIEKKPTKPQPNNNASAQTAGNQGINGSDHKQNSNMQETGAKASTSGSNNIEAEFDLLVKQHLLAKKTTPNIRSNIKQGTVTVEFTLNRQGEILNYRLRHPSKIREFDRTVIKLIKQAQPFPAPPKEITWDNRIYTIDINYQVK